MLMATGRAWKYMKGAGGPWKSLEVSEGYWKVLVVPGVVHIIGERKKNIIYGECYLSAIMHKKLEFGLKKSKKWIFTL